jgi:DNA repair protein RecN (Recombination protein N)
MPQVASLAHRHFLVTKVVENEQTNSGLELIEGQKRTKELARMLGGVGPETLALAAKLVGV